MSKTLPQQAPLHVVNMSICCNEHPFFALINSLSTMHALVQDKGKHDVSTGTCRTFSSGGVTLSQKMSGVYSSCKVPPPPNHENERSQIDQ